MIELKKLRNIILIICIVGAFIIPKINILAEKQQIRMENEKNVTKKENENSLGLISGSYVLIEGSTGKIILEKNKEKKLMPASITKIMTLILIFEAIDEKKIKLTDEVTVSEYAASMGGSQVYLEPNEKQTVEAMIKCISIASANDACVAMAEHISGSETEFVKEMNKKAKQLGMKNTKFMNCCGLDDTLTENEHYSTAYDIALMSRELITKHKEIEKYSTIWMDNIIHITRKGESEFGLTNTNKLVRYYNGITGLKTGSTSKAKYCLSATARRDGMNLIAVVMAAPEPQTRFQEAAKLLDYGFSNCSIYKDTNKKIMKKKIPIQKGIKEDINIKAKQKFSYVCVNGETEDEISKKMQWKEEIVAPVKKGEKIGKVIYYYKEKKIGEVAVVSTESVRRADYVDYLKQICKQYFLGI